MFNYFISLVKHLPEIRSLEHALTSKAYWEASPDLLKETFLGRGEPLLEIHQMPKLVNSLVDTFKKMPLSLQLDHIFNIKCYEDESTYLEDYKISSTASLCVLLNRIMVSYAQVILPQLEREQKDEFLQKLHNNIHKGGFMNSQFHEADELALIETWQLENELIKNHFCCTKKTVKI